MKLISTRRLPVRKHVNKQEKFLAKNLSNRLAGRARGWKIRIEILKWKCYGGVIVWSVETTLKTGMLPNIVWEQQLHNEFFIVYSFSYNILPTLRKYVSIEDKDACAVLSMSLQLWIYVSEFDNQCGVLRYFLKEYYSLEKNVICK